MKLILQSIVAMLTFAFYGFLHRPKRASTRDVAFTYRMGTGFPGDVNRMHPASIMARLINATDPPRAYGEACLWDTANGIRCIKASDQSDATAVTIAGCLVRPYPTQQSSGGMNASLGAATPPTSGIGDIVHTGNLFVKGKAGMTVKAGDQCYVWAAATSGANIQGEFQSGLSSGNTVPLANARYMGPADATGVVEVNVRAG